MTLNTAAASARLPAGVRRLVATLVLTVAVSATLGAFGAPASAAPVAGVCTVWASPTGSDAAVGTSASPFKTLKRLADALGAGSVGCLRGGTYAPGGGLDGITINRGGVAGNPATIRSAPGETVTFQGRLVVAATAHDLVIAGIRFDGTSVTGSEASSFTVEADRVSLIGNDITAPDRICVAVGYARAVSGLVIDGNRIHHCGDGFPLKNGKPVRQEHGIYLQQTRGAIVRNNVLDRNFTRGIQLYYDADGTLIENNVIDANEDGINLGGKRVVLNDGTVLKYRSESNVIRNNLITNSSLWVIESYYDEVGPVGDLANVVTANCLFGASRASTYNKLEGFRYDASNRWVDPQYNGQSAGDYRIRSTSPCIGKGLRAAVTPLRVRSLTHTAATFDAALNPHRMTTTYFVRVRPCSDRTCTTVGPWTSTATAQSVGVVDTRVTRTITGLAPATTYQYQWVAHQALLPASNPAALVVSPAAAFTTAP